ncbi:MAG: hypothetical protein AB7V58_03155 [Solirubrobacterales bacterium]
MTGVRGIRAATSPSRLRSGFGGGVRTALRNNLSAYGLSVMITASFGSLHAEAPDPERTDWIQVAALYGALATLDPSPPR